MLTAARTCGRIQLSKATPDASKEKHPMSTDIQAALPTECQSGLARLFGGGA